MEFAVTYRDRLISFLRCLQGTTVYPLLASVLFDESEWEHPHNFYPAHFLDKEGNFVKRDAFLPFSAGLWTQTWLFVMVISAVRYPEGFCSLVQVVGFVLERVWPGWSSSSSSPPSCSTLVSLLRLEFHRMNSICLQLWGIAASLYPINCVQSLQCKEEQQV